MIAEYFVIRRSTCSRCDGVGRIQKGQRSERCFECDGKGLIEDYVSLQTALEDIQDD